MIEEVRAKAAARMGKSIEALRHELAKIRTGRAHTSLLDHVTAEYYGSEVPLSQVASINVEDARTLSISPWEKGMVPVIERAILNSDLGLNPSTAGTVIRVPVPPLTEERRKELVKVVRHETENARVAIRNIRRDAINDLKNLKKNKQIAEDDERRAEDLIQKLTDQYIQQAEQVLADKEKDLMEL